MEIEKKYQMRKEHKVEAYIGLEKLSSAHFELSNIYIYALGRKEITEEELKTFDDLFCRLTGLRYEVKEGMFEDDEFWKNRFK